MTYYSLPSVVLFLPLLGALFLLFIRGDEQIVFQNSRHVALLITACVFILSFVSFLFYEADPEKYLTQAFTHLVQTDWRVGIDALSMIFVLLISFLTVLSVCVIRRHVSFCVREFSFLVLTAESFMLIAVCSQNMFQFFVFWEAAVLPLFLMTAVWGAEKRIFTAYKFCFSDLLGAICLMPALFLLAQKAGSADYAALARLKPDETEQTVLLVCFLAALAFKAPLFPFHAWLSDTQAEAPVPTGILLCGIFSKLIFYAFLRLALPALESVPDTWRLLLLIWAAFSAVYGALITLKQVEIKKIAGFAHLAQVGFLGAGLFCAAPATLQSLLFLCVAQGLAFTVYLMSAGALYARFNDAGMKEPTGLMKLFPYLGMTFFLSCLAVLGVPPLMPFTGQFLIFYDVFGQSKIVAFFLLLSVVLLYSAFFRLFTRLLFGEPPQQSAGLPDMSWREKTAAIVFGSVFLILSVTPGIVFDLARQAIGG